MQQQYNQQWQVVVIVGIEKEQQQQQLVVDVVVVVVIIVFVVVLVVAVVVIVVVLVCNSSSSSRIQCYVKWFGDINKFLSSTCISAARPFTPVVYEYIEQIQKEVNKVQGHPSDLYPELFTPHIVSALIDENEGMFATFSPPLPVHCGLCHF